MMFFNAANGIASNYIKQSLQNARRNEQKQNYGRRLDLTSVSSRENKYREKKEIVDKIWKWVSLIH